MPEPVKYQDQADGSHPDASAAPAEGGAAERAAAPGQVTALFSRAGTDGDVPDPARPQDTGGSPSRSDRPSPTAQPSAGSDHCLTLEQLQILRQRAGAKDVDDETAEELSAALGLAERIRARGIHVDAAFDRLSFVLDCLLAEKPRLILARDTRLRLQLETHYRSGLISRMLARLSSGSPVALVLAALVMSLMIWTVAVAIVHLAAHKAVSDLGYQAFFMNGKALLVITSAAFVGGVVSIATRLREFAGVRDLDPFAMFWTALLKPLIGVVLALFLLATLAGEMISFGFLGSNPLELPTGPDVAPGVVKEKTYYILWVLGFLAGFSERFAWDFVDRAQGAASGGLGGDKKT
jgi:hypothetical protein